jgi:very-short-patch-repair endonuclease
VRDGIPLTSVARTLLDLAGVVRRRQLERAVEAAERLRLMDLRDVVRALARGRGRRGVRLLRDVLGDYREPAFTRSELERMLLDLVREAGLPQPSANKWIAGGEADLVWDNKRLVVELDSRGFHQTRAAFERDRRRDTDLQLAGYRVLRVTHRRLEQEPADVVAAVARLLGDPSP